MRVIITGGGTGGHLSIAKALALECKKRGHFVAYIGSTSGQDRLWFEGAGIFSAHYFLNTSGVVNKKGLGALGALFFQAKAALKCVGILRSLRTDCVISVGGFSAAGAAAAAILTRTPLFIHEQNAIFGTLNRLLSPFARAVFGSFELARKNFIRTAYPTNAEFFATFRRREALKCVLILGGSQGARGLNLFALSIARELQNRGVKILHQCGERDFWATKRGYEELGFEVLEDSPGGDSAGADAPREDSQNGDSPCKDFSQKDSPDGAKRARFGVKAGVFEAPAAGRKTQSLGCENPPRGGENPALGRKNFSKECESPAAFSIELFSFDKNLEKKMAGADFCIARSGASSLWELCANGLPAYFVPYPFAFKNHQFFNAMFLKKQGLCEVVAQDSLNCADFLGYVDAFDFGDVSEKLRANAAPDGAREVLDKIEANLARH